jgi:hypothetical protein
MIFGSHRTIDSFLLPIVLGWDSPPNNRIQTPAMVYTAPSVRRPMLIWNVLICLFGYERSVYSPYHYNNLCRKHHFASPLLPASQTACPRQMSPSLFLDTPVYLKRYRDRMFGKVDRTKFAPAPQSKWHCTTASREQTLPIIFQNSRNLIHERRSKTNMLPSSLDVQTRFSDQLWPAAATSYSRRGMSGHSKNILDGEK